MNKSELVAAIAERASLSKKDAEAALNAFTDTVADALKKGDKITLVGFGTFETRARAAREGRKAEPKRYNVDLVSNREGLRDFRNPFFVVDYRRYLLLFGVIRTMTIQKKQRDKKRYR